MVVPKRRVFIDVTALRQSRDLRVLLGGQLVSLLGTQLTVVAVPYQVYRLTHSSLDAGLVSLADGLSRRPPGRFPVTDEIRSRFRKPPSRNPPSKLAIAESTGILNPCQMSLMLRQPTA